MYQHNLKGYNDSKVRQSKVDTCKVSISDCLYKKTRRLDSFSIIENIIAANIFREICLSKAIFLYLWHALAQIGFDRHSIGSVWLHSVCGEPRKFNV